MKALRRAIRDTKNGQIQALFGVTIGGLIGLAYLYFDQGRAEAMAEVPYWEAAVFGSLGALVLLFLWNLACAPYRIERDARIKAEGDADMLRKKLSANAQQNPLDNTNQDLINALGNLKTETSNFCQSRSVLDAKGKREAYSLWIDAHENVKRLSDRLTDQRNIYEECQDAMNAAARAVVSADGGLFPIEELNELSAIVRTLQAGLRKSNF